MLGKTPRARRAFGDGSVQISARKKPFDAESDARPVAVAEMTGDNQRAAQKIAARRARLGAKSRRAGWKRRRIEREIVVHRERLQTVVNVAESSDDDGAKTLDGKEDRSRRNQRIIYRTRASQIETVALLMRYGFGFPLK